MKGSTAILIYLLGMVGGIAVCMMIAAFHPIGVCPA